MEIAKLFRNGHRQAVRFPKQRALPGDKVCVKRLGAIVLLIPKDQDPWEPFVDSPGKFSHDFFGFGRYQETLEKRGAFE
jgi:antitoxin VapB